MIGWDDLRFVLAIERAGSLSAAARDLSVNQTTVGRRLALLEESLQTRIFSHDGRRYQLTRAGERLLPRAQRMETEALPAVSSLSFERYVVTTSFLQDPGAMLKRLVEQVE